MSCNFRWRSSPSASIYKNDFCEVNDWFQFIILYFLWLGTIFLRILSFFFCSPWPGHEDHQNWALIKDGAFQNLSRQIHGNRAADTHMLTNPFIWQSSLLIDCLPWEEIQHKRKNYIKTHACWGSPTIVVFFSLSKWKILVLWSLYFPEIATLNQCKLCLESAVTSFSRSQIRCGLRGRLRLEENWERD